MIVRSTRVCVSSVGEIIIQRSSSFVDRWRMKKKRDEQKGTFELHQNALGMTCIIDPPSTNAPEVSSRFSCKCTVRTWGLRSVDLCAKITRIVHDNINFSRLFLRMKMWVIFVYNATSNLGIAQDDIILIKFAPEHQTEQQTSRRELFSVFHSFFHSSPTHFNITFSSTLSSPYH